MNNNELQNLIQTFASKNGATPEQMKADANKDKVENLMKNLNDKQADKVKEILSDPKKSQEILNSPAAQELMKKLMK